MSVAISDQCSRNLWDLAFHRRNQSLRDQGQFFHGCRILILLIIWRDLVGLPMIESGQQPDSIVMNKNNSFKILDYKCLKWVHIINPFTRCSSLLIWLVCS